MRVYFKSIAPYPTVALHELKAICKKPDSRRSSGSLIAYPATTIYNIAYQWFCVVCRRGNVALYRAQLVQAWACSL